MRPAGQVGGGGRLLRQIVGLGAIVGVASIFLATRGAGVGGEASLEAGLAALRGAIETRAAPCFDQAEHAFAQAAGGVVFDPYPMMLLQLTHGIREGRVVGADAEVAVVIAALGRADWDGATRALDAVPGDRAGRVWLVRAVSDLRRKKSVRNCGLDPI